MPNTNLVLTPRSRILESRPRADSASRCYNPTHPHLPPAYDPVVLNDRPPLARHSLAHHAGRRHRASTAATAGRNESRTRIIPSVVTWRKSSPQSRCSNQNCCAVFGSSEQPGYLSREYFAGRRVRYIKPLQLFIFLNVVYYFSLTVFTATTFTTPLATQLHMNNYYPGYASRRVDHKLQVDKISYATLESKYNGKTAILSKTLIFLLIPIFALLFFMLFFRHRKFFVEHLVVATHFWSFSLLLLGVILPAVSLLLIRAFTANKHFAELRNQ